MPSPEPCTPGYSNEWGNCTMCGDGMTSDGGNGKCYCAAGSFAFLSGMFCNTCPRHTFSNANDTQCIECPEDQLSAPLQRSCINQSDCDTSKGFVKTNNSCTCPSKSALSLDGSTCVLECGANTDMTQIVDEYQEQQYCLCLNGYVTAPGDKYCMKMEDCSAENNMSLINYKCQCANDSFIVVQDEQSNKTTCELPISCDTSSKYVPGYNKCTPCPMNAESDGGQSTECHCSQGFIQIDGICAMDVPSCQTNQYINSGVCIDCPDNSTSPGGASHLCQCVNKSQEWNGTQCVVKQTMNQESALHVNQKADVVFWTFLAIVFSVIVISVIVTVVVTIRNKRRNQYVRIAQTEPV